MNREPDYETDDRAVGVRKGWTLRDFLIVVIGGVLCLVADWLLFHSFLGR